MRHKLTWWVACLLAAAGSSRAAPDPTASPPSPAVPLAPAAAVTLGEAMALAWARSPSQRALASRLEQQSAADALARGVAPAAATVSLGSLNDRLNRNSGRQEWEAAISMPLWLPGQRSARQRLAGLQRAGMEHDTLQRKLDLAGELRERWWAAATASAALGLALGRVEAVRALLDDVTRRHAAGDLARTDTNTVAVELSTAEAALHEARQVDLAARGRLRLLAGVPIEPRIDPSTAAQASVPASLADALARAAQHPRQSAAETAVSLAQARLDVASRSGREAPAVAVRLVRERGDAAEPYANAVGVTLSLPLALPARQLHDTAQARAELQEAQAQLQQVSEQIVLDLEAAYQQRDAAAARAALAARRATLTAETLHLLQRSFSLGEADLATLQRARSAAHEARVELQLAEVARAAALSHVQQALGVLP